MSEYKNAIEVTKSVQVTLFDAYVQDSYSVREALGTMKGSDGSKFEICRDLNGCGFYVETTVKGKKLTAYFSIYDLLKDLAVVIDENKEKL